MIWLLPAMGYILVNGLLGITAKLALRTVSWPTTIFWAAIVYDLLAVILALFGTVRLRWTFDGAMAGASGALAASGLVLFFVAVQGTAATRVVPFMAAYPLITVILGALILAERITLMRALGCIVIVGGAILIAAGPAGAAK